MSKDETIPIWVPSSETTAIAQVTAFITWVNDRYGLNLAGYDALWHWSVADVDQFWRAIWDYFELGEDVAAGAGLANAAMPGAQWFPGQQINYAQKLLQRAPVQGPAIIHYDAALSRREVSRDELFAKVVQMADAMRKAGIGMGDRVVACLPNRPETVIALLATAAIGAVWSVVSPETGADGMIARFAQLEPKLLLTVEGYRFRGDWVDRRAEIAQVVAQVPSLEKVVSLPGEGEVGPYQSWADFIVSGSAHPDTFEFAKTPFEHPLWALFSSGTTGIPKAMAQSHGGIVLEMMKNSAFHLDLGAGERMFFYTITGWMVWNVAVSALLVGASTVLYDGQPHEPDLGQLWRIAESSQATVMGGSPAWQSRVAQSGYRPADHGGFKKLRHILLSGSPASPECMRWFLSEVKPDLWIQSSCGGTDVCTAFVGGSPILPVYAGEIQTRCLGVDAAVLDEDGAELANAVGELVIRQPMPSMPVKFWNDPDYARYTQTYFDMYPGQWRQGDFARINARGGVYVLGRSDATLNRQGVRIGTAEIYAALEGVPELVDSMILGIDRPDGSYWMPLFVTLKPEHALDERLKGAIRMHLKTTLSPRHVPDDILALTTIPYTRTGKRLEVPLRRILAGTPLKKALAREAVDDLAAINQLLEIANTL